MLLIAKSMNINMVMPETCTQEGSRKYKGERDECVWPHTTRSTMLCFGLREHLDVQSLDLFYVTRRGLNIFRQTLHCTVL